MKKILSVKHVIISIVMLIGIWELLFLVSDFSETLFPSPLLAWQALLEMCGDGTLITNIGTSMYRFLAGYISSVIIAVILGLVLGRLPGVFKYVNPVVQLLRPISPTAWMPFIVLLFGIGGSYYIYCRVFPGVAFNRCGCEKCGPGLFESVTEFWHPPARTYVESDLPSGFSTDCKRNPSCAWNSVDLSCGW